MTKNYYSILDIEKKASQEEIKQAYRKQAMRYHPDKNPGDVRSEERFKEIAEAYEILSDPDKKAKYDRPEPSIRASFFGTEDPFAEYMRTTGATANEFNPFARAKTRTQTPPKPPPKRTKGSAISINIPITLSEMIQGTQKKIRLKRSIKCSSCNGSGETPYKKCTRCGGSGYALIHDHYGGDQRGVCPRCSGDGREYSEPCHKCKGSKTEPIEDVIDINIPRGTIAGMQFVVSGKGHDDGESDPGDLVVFIKELPDDEFIRIGTNIKTIREISVIDAILGCKIRVNLPNGETIQTIIEPGTHHGAVLQFPGKGIPEINMGSMKGDFLVEIHIKIPKAKTREDHELLESLKSTNLFGNE